VALLAAALRAPLRSAAWLRRCRDEAVAATELLGKEFNIGAKLRPFQIFLTTNARCSGSNGLVMKSSAPALIASTARSMRRAR